MRGYNLVIARPEKQKSALRKERNEKVVALSIAWVLATIGFIGVFFFFLETREVDVDGDYSENYTVRSLLTQGFLFPFKWRDLTFLSFGNHTTDKSIEIVFNQTFQIKISSIEWENTENGVFSVYQRETETSPCVFAGFSHLRGAFNEITRSVKTTTHDCPLNSSAKNRFGEYDVTPIQNKNRFAYVLHKNVTSHWVSWAFFNQTNYAGIGIEAPGLVLKMGIVKDDFDWQYISINQRIDGTENIKEICHIFSKATYENFGAQSIGCYIPGRSSGGNGKFTLLPPAVYSMYEKWKIGKGIKQYGVLRTKNYIYVVKPNAVRMNALGRRQYDCVYDNGILSCLITRPNGRHQRPINLLV